MRKLMWFSIGFGAACALSVYILPTGLPMLLGLLCVAIACGVRLLREHAYMRIVATICFGLAVGQLWYGCYDQLRLRPAREMDGQTANLTLEAVDYSYPSSYGIVVDCSTVVDGQSYKIRVYLDQKDPLAPGSVVEGDFRLRYTAPGGQETATSHSGNGILLLAYPKGDAKTVPAAQTYGKYFPIYLRERLLEIIESRFPQDVSGFVKALLLGETYDLGYERDTALAITGLRHVAAVSGLHVSMVFSMVYFVSGKRRGLTVLLGIPVLFLFAAVAGFTPSIVRASMMQLLMLGAMVLKREYDPPTSLSFAALTILAADPLVITSVGFQLSVGSVAGILLFSGHIVRWLMDAKRLGRWSAKTGKGKLAHWISASVSVSLSALVMTTPLTAFYFGTVSLVGPLTNLLCLWIITYIFCGCGITCLIGMIYVPLADSLAWILGWMIRYVLGITDLLAKIPLAALYTASIYIVAWLLFAYVLLAIFLWSKEKRPWLLSCCAVLGLCIALLASWLEPRLDTYRMTVLDVGQGQCVLLQSEGRTYMVDCGGDYDEETANMAAGTLLSQGISRLDGLILSHYDRDHVGAAAYLLSRIPADLLVLPVGSGSEEWEEELLEGYSNTTIVADRDFKISWGDAEITIFASFDREISNESSLCVLFQTEKCDILITGDRGIAGEQMLLATEDIPQLDVLVVGHHGAASSTGEAFLAVVKPHTAVISVGKNNSYGHPADQVLERLAAFGCQVRRTDLEGTILIRG